jgi:hypothetical protein
MNHPSGPEEIAASHCLRPPPREAAIDDPAAFGFGPTETALYPRWLDILERAGARYALGGAFALYAWTGIWRATKDLDVFIAPADLDAALGAFRVAGYDTEVRDHYWLAKVCSGPCFMDVIFGLSNHAVEIGTGWFASARPFTLLGARTRILGPEELMASKIYVARSDRFDGADILHLVAALQGCLDWDRVLALLGEDEALLLWHLVLFAYVYPGRGAWLPEKLMADLFARAMARMGQTRDERAFYGHVIDPLRFAVDTERLGYTAAREAPPPVDGEGKAR